MHGKDRRGNKIESIDKLWTSFPDLETKDYFSQGFNEAVSGDLKDKTNWYTYIIDHYDK